MNSNRKTIDLGKAIREGNNKFLKSLPSFVVRLMEKLVKQDEINATINRSSHLEGIPFLVDVLDGWKVEVLVKGFENVPPSGRFVFASNHPVGAMDALAIYVAIGKKFNDIVSPANELLYTIPNLRNLMLGVNAFGRNSRETAAKLNELFESDKQIMIFPAGEVSRKKGKIIRDIQWQKTFITKAVQTGRDIIPVHISGRNSQLFYTVASLRKKLGIKMYVESLLLPREMINQRGRPVTVTFGKPLTAGTITSDMSHSEWAEKIKEMVYELPRIYN